MKNKLWHDPYMLSRAFKKVFEDEPPREWPKDTEEAFEELREASENREPPECFIDEITGDYVLVFPSGRKQKYRSKAVAREIVRWYGADSPVFIPYRETYDPTDPSPTVKATDGLMMNVYERSQYQRADLTKKSTSKFPTIEALLMNVIPENASRQAFLNWLAVIFNTGKKTGTAWVILGPQGSGKTMLFEKVLTPLLGSSNCIELNQDALSTRYNLILDRRQLICFNEVHSSKQASERLKTWITEDHIRLEDKTVRASLNKNFLNLVFTSNSQVPVALEADDRRFSVVRTGGPLLSLPWFAGEASLRAIDRELGAFATYLKQFPYSESDARKPVDNEEKRRLIAASVDPIDRLANMLRMRDYPKVLESLHGETLSDEVVSELSNFSDRLSKEIVLKIANSMDGAEFNLNTLTRALRERGIVTGRCRENSEGKRPNAYVWGGPQNLDKLDK